MTATDRPTEPPVECVAVDRDERCLCPGGPASHRPSPPAPAAEDDAVLDRKPVRNHPDTEARNALAGFVIDRMHPWVQGGYVAYSARHGIAGDFLHWLDEHRPGWRDDAAEVDALRAEVERSERDWKQASEDADRWYARAEAAEAEVERLTDLLHTVTNDATARDARREVAERQVADLRAGIEVLRKQWEGEVRTGHGARREGLRKALDDLADLLATSGEQPGEAWCEHYAPGAECPACSPAPVIPDSAGLRSVVAARVAFEEAGVRLMAVAGTDATRYLDALGRVVAAGATVGDIAALASPLAVVGQGVTAEQAWDEGFADGKRHALEGDDGPRFVNPYRAVVRSGEQGGE